MNPTYTDKGSLQIFVTAGEDPSPIPNARVRISDPADGKVLEGGCFNPSPRRTTVLRCVRRLGIAFRWVESMMIRS